MKDTTVIVQDSTLCGDMIALKKEIMDTLGPLKITQLALSEWPVSSTHVDDKRRKNQQETKAPQKRKKTQTPGDDPKGTETDTKRKPDKQPSN
jgi:hypothetical protein